MFTTINLQMFANHVNVTTDVRTSGQTYPEHNDLSAEMKTFYDMTLIDEASPNLVHRQFGQVRNIPANGGKKIEFRKFSALPKAMTPLTEGVTPDGKRLDVTSITAEVAQYGDYIVQSDVLELTSLDNTIIEATKILGKQAGATLDTAVRNILNSGTNVSYCTAKRADGTEVVIEDRDDLDTDCVLTVKEVQKAVTKLKNQNAPKINGAYVAIIHPSVAYDLMRDPEFIECTKYGRPEDLYEGEIGKIAGVRFVESTEAKVWKTADSGHAVFSTLFIGDNAYGTTEITGGGLETIVKQKGSSGTADPLNQRSSIGWKGMVTAEILVQNYIVRVESCSPDFDSTEEN